MHGMTAGAGLTSLWLPLLCEQVCQYLVPSRNLKIRGFFQYKHVSMAASAI